MLLGLAPVAAWLQQLVAGVFSPRRYWYNESVWTKLLKIAVDYRTTSGR
jgi:hypothetical protein